MRLLPLIFACVGVGLVAVGVWSGSHRGIGGIVDAADSATLAGESAAYPQSNSNNTDPNDSARQPIEVAITIDDFPAVGSISEKETREEIMRRTINTLRSADVKDVTGFANAYWLENHPGMKQLMQTWAYAGFGLGNHTYSHLHLHASETADYIKDIERNEDFLRDWTGGENWRLLRFPFLEEGRDIEQWRTINTYLKGNGYKVAEVTFDFRDWMWNDPWVRCKDAGNERGMNFLKATYLNAMVYSFRSGIDVSIGRWGRPLKFILLLHINSVTSALLPDLITTLRNQGVRFISLEEAMSDEAYAEVSSIPGGLPTFQYDWHNLYSDYAMLEDFVVPAQELSEICR